MSDHTPFLTFDRAEWRKFRHDTPLTLTEEDLERIRGFNEPISMTEVAEVYLPIARLLNLYVEATQELYQATSQFLGNPAPRVPYIIGVAGSVAVGKSTISRLMQSLLSRWPAHREVDIVTTDGFLFPNAVLEQRGLMEGLLCGLVDAPAIDDLNGAQITASYRIKFDPTANGPAGGALGTLEGMIITPCRG
jgi:type I pantothenate kinase